MTLTARERERYAAQLAMPEWGERAQERLKAASAVVVGAGSLGSAAATYLACAGVGRIGIVERDWVALSDLARQPLHFTPDVEAQKAESAAQKLGVLNTEITVEPYPVELDAANAEALVSGADVVVDCGSPATRLVVNDACCAQRVPLVVAVAAGFGGVLQALLPGTSACHRCAFPDGFGELAHGGPVGAVAGVVGSLQALAALALLTGVGEPAPGAVVRFHGPAFELRVAPVERRPDCSACAGLAASPESRWRCSDSEPWRGWRAS